MIVDSSDSDSEAAACEQTQFGADDSGGGDNDYDSEGSGGQAEQLAEEELALQVRSYTCSLIVSFRYGI